jgi:hypothetical protein
MMPLELLHNESFDSSSDERQDDDKVSPKTVNRTLEVARTNLKRSARVWRGDDWKPWLGASPLIEMLEGNRRQPYPISWEERRWLFAELPPRLERSALFSVKTGARDENICGVKWEWERRIPELNRSVFVVPGEQYKGKRPHVLVLNDVALMPRCARYQVFIYAHPVRGINRDRMDRRHASHLRPALAERRRFRGRLHSESRAKSRSERTRAYRVRDGKPLILLR